MNSKPLQPIVKKYQQVKEAEFGMSPEMSIGGDTVEEDKLVAGDSSTLDWNTAGLYEPETPQEVQAAQAAVRDLSRICSNLDRELKGWGERYRKIGADDTISREQVAQYIAKSILGLVALD